MRSRGRVRGLVLMLRIFGWILVVLQVFTAFMSIVGIVLDGAAVVYIQNLIHTGFWLLIGIVLLIVAGAVKKKHVNDGTWE